MPWLEIERNLNNLVDDFRVVYVELLKKVVVSDLEHGLEAFFRDSKDVLLVKLVLFDLVAYEFFGHVRAQKESDLVFQVLWQQLLDHCGELLPAELPLVRG